jgi:hypothetical protein
MQQAEAAADCGVTAQDRKALAEPERGANTIPVKAQKCYEEKHFINPTGMVLGR